MSITDQIEATILRLPPQERERIAIAAWESLAKDIEWLANPLTDADGLKIAAERDREIESGDAKSLTHEEFARRTRSAAG